jgi:hypothetical protein
MGTRLHGRWRQGSPIRPPSPGARASASRSPRLRGGRTPDVASTSSPAGTPGTGSNRSAGRGAVDRNVHRGGTVGDDGPMPARTDGSSTRAGENHCVAVEPCHGRSGKNACGRRRLAWVTIGLVERSLRLEATPRDHRRTSSTAPNRARSAPGAAKSSACRRRTLGRPTMASCLRGMGGHAEVRFGL